MAIIMKSIKQIIRISHGIIVLAIVVVLVLGCSKDDDSAGTLEAMPPEVTFTALNTCDIGGCCLATEFDFTISYESSNGSEINKITVSIQWSDGDTDTFETNDFTDSGTVVTYDWCYRFSESEWVDVSHVLVGKDGSKSNSSMVRVNKPEGGN